MATRAFPAPSGITPPAGSTPLASVTPGTAHMVLISDGTAAGTGYAQQAAFRGPTGATGPAGPQGLQGPQGIQGPAGPAGSGTGTSFTPGRSLSLVGGTLDASGMHNARSYGAIGDGVPRTLAQMASFRGQNTSGWTLSQWQQVLPHATAMTNRLDWACVQDAVRTAKARGGGRVVLPTGGYTMDAANPVVLGANPSVHLSGEGNASVLLFSDDLGSGKSGIKADDPGAIESHVEITDLQIQGNVGNTAIGVRPMQMNGVELNRAMHMRNFYVRGFNAGVLILNDHQRMTNGKITGCYYNVYCGPGSQTYGNQYFQFLNLDGAKFASIAVAPDGSLDTISMYSVHGGFAPYGLYKEAAPAGQDPSKGLLTNSTLIDVSMEACGNGGWFDENRNSNIANNALHNVNIDMNPWGDGMYVADGRGVAAAIHCGLFTNNRVTGAQELVVSGAVYGRVTRAAIVTRVVAAGNDFGGIAGWIGNAVASGGKPYLISEGSQESNEWRGNGAAGVLANVVEQSAPVPAGTLMRVRYGTQHAFPWDGSSPIAGVAAMPGANNSAVPIATRGLVQVRKVGGAIFTGGRVAASLAAIGAAEAPSNAVSAPHIGQAIGDAAAGTGAVEVRLDLRDSRFIGNTPTLSYSRATENAAQAQLRAAMVAQGLAVDATTA